ncbi:MAG: hypothetical protein AB9891_06275 [Anaerolineaceae bacterium]
MKKAVKFFSLILIGFSILACNLGGIVQTEVKTATVSPTQPPSETPAVVEPSPASDQGVDENQISVILDPCSLVTTAEAEAIFSEPSNPPQPMNGMCIFTNAKDALYMVSVAAAQDQETTSLMEGQTMMVGFAGGKLDDARMEKIKSMAAALDYKGVFSELVIAAEGLPTLKARLVEDADSDPVFWVWITAQNRRQAAFVAVREWTLVGINLIVSDTQSEESMLAASKLLADRIFERLPVKFTLPKPMPIPTQPPPTPTPTIIGEVTVPQAFPTAVPTLIPQSGPTPVPTWVGPTPVPPSGPSPVPPSGPTLVPTFVK